MYIYEAERVYLFTGIGQVMFLAIRDNVKYLLETSGACTMGKAIHCNISGNTWQMMACVDRLVELKEIAEIPQHSDGRGQDRVFVKKER